MKKNEFIYSLIASLVDFEKKNQPVLSFEGLGLALKALEKAEKVLYYALSDVEEKAINSEINKDIYTEIYIYRKAQLSIYIIMYDIYTGIHNVHLSPENRNYMQTSVNNIAKEIDETISKLKEVMLKLKCPLGQLEDCKGFFQIH